MGSPSYPHPLPKCYHCLWNLFPWRSMAAWIWQLSGQCAPKFAFPPPLLSLGLWGLRALPHWEREHVNSSWNCWAAGFPDSCKLPQNRNNHGVGLSSIVKPNQNQTKNQKQLPKTEDKWEQFTPLNMKNIIKRQMKNWEKIFEIYVREKAWCH